jgi:hypothetical protein
MGQLLVVVQSRLKEIQTHAQLELIPGQLYRFLEPLRVQLQLTWDQN